MSLNSLNLLLVDGDPQKTERISAALESANHKVLPASGFEEASEAFSVEKFDAVLVGSPIEEGELADFAAKLRKLERNQHSATRTPVLTFSPVLSDGLPAKDGCPGIDGFLPEHFEPAAITLAIANLAGAVGKINKSEATLDSLDFPVFEAEEFQEQVGFDQDLLIEIVNLFIEERTQQLPEMADAIASGNYDRLSRLAHTIKGSLGSLHAPLARARAQELELAAKQRNQQLCQELLQAFKQDLERLEPMLLALRDAEAVH